MGGKGGKSQEARGSQTVYAHHYTHRNLSTPRQASIITFFPFPVKPLFCFFKQPHCCHDSGHPSISAVPPARMHVSASMLRQKGPRKRARWNNSVRASLWSAGCTICGAHYKAFPLSLLAFVINGSDIRQAV